MHIVTDTAEAQLFARELRFSLKRSDYWQDWCVLDLNVNPPLDWINQAKISTLLHSFLAEQDGSVLWLDGRLLVIYKGKETVNIEALQKNIQKNLEVGEVSANLLLISREAAEVAALLERVQSPYVEMKKEPVASYSTLKTLVPNIDELLHEWHEKKIGHEGRDKPLIMIVDDDPVTLKLVMRALSLKYEVVPAQNCAEAVAKHLQLMPDIIFLDIGLPDCSGLTLLKYMQQYDQGCHVVMFSGDDFLKTRVSAFAGGAKGFLGKPFNLKSFQNQIAQWFAGTKA